ncbi:MAG: hypothetical protein L0Y72_12880 [Gemmataceae bacterium]|nr:hypothetical protein [Gemmataceae bacterium]MCI0739934.1 hypothetical protein [Gemmataceae bacterium]
MQHVVPGPNDTAIFNAMSPLSVADIAFAGTILNLRMEAAFAAGMHLERTLTVTNLVDQNAGILGALPLYGSLILPAGGTYDWKAGSIVSAGGGGGTIVSLAANSTMNIETNVNHDLIGGAITNSGTIRFKGGNLSLDQGASVDNRSGSVFSFEGTAVDINGGSAENFYMTQATLNKTNNAFSTIGPSFRSFNSSINVHAWNLYLGYGSNSVAEWSTFNVTAASAILATAGLSFHGNNTVAGSGTWQIGWNLGMTTLFADIGQDDVVTASVHTVELYGTLKGAGVLNFEGSFFRWIGGSVMEGSGTTNILPGREFAIVVFSPEHTSHFAEDRTINNEGITTWFAGPIALTTATFNNLSSGVFDVKCDELLLSGAFNNYGVFKKTGSAGAMTRISWTTWFSQYGTLEFYEGTTRFERSLTQTSGQSRFLGGNLLVLGTFTIQMGSSVSAAGLGQIWISAFHVVNSGTITVSTLGNNTFTVAKIFDGEEYVGGRYTQSSTGLLYLKIASALLYDRVVIEGDANLGGTLNLSVIGELPLQALVFNLLTAGTRNNQFEYWNLPPQFTLTYGPTSVNATYNP